ncbi:hypothetical protein COCVIDRAFT_17223 [Bipolaris victoriae FI3]|uniref:Uncharacterized protein n=1 Tax=Bipolaris victoriae (strain FI3) TaxID=930091 RepID=W7EIM9_BIPV3|nr:hypothetical protein COCVIDRAFT_17223 [Bipolaris victoriae FI3]
MTTVCKVARSHAQCYPLLIAAGSVLVMLAGFLLFGGWTTLLPTEPFLPRSSSTLTFNPNSTATPPICIACDPLVYDPPASRPVDKPLTVIIYRLIASTRNALQANASKLGEGLLSGGRLGALDFAFDLPFWTVIVAVLLTASILLIEDSPSPWASRYQTSLVNVLQFLVVLFCASHKFEGRHSLVLVFVMVAFDLFQHAVGCTPFDAIVGGESHHSPQQTSPSETPDIETRTTSANASAAITGTRNLIPALAQRSSTPDTSLITFDAKDREIVRLQRSLTELKTAHKATETQLRISKEELFNARETLNGTFAEYANLREELKIVKQNLGRDHQAIVYRKDIELFALRKGNEQKDACIKERDARLEEMARQHKATIEVKDAQLRLMKERIISIERQAELGHSDEADEGDHALEVRLLRVRKGRDSKGGEEDKDLIIAKLQEQLAAIAKPNEYVVNHQAELSRAWDVAKKTKKALKEERERHVQTQEKLEEVTIKLAEADSQSESRGSPLPGRLPTINENDHDKNELEAMFDTTQEENLRLYAEVTALEKRLADANARMFAAVRESEAFREQYKSEQPVNEDTKTVRPSLVHHVHFQRMEDQLDELRRTLKIKEEEAKKFRKTIADKDQHIKEIQGELDAAASFHTQDQDEIERLKQSIAELQATKYQLMLDRERLVTHRPRQRVLSAERTERTSARSSGATLIQEMSPPSTTPSEENTSTPVPQEVEVQEREGSIQQTPVRHVRGKRSVKSINTRWNLMSQDLPPPELRAAKGTRSKSASFKDVMQKMVGSKTQDSVIRRVLVPKDKNATPRPSTSASIKPSKPIERSSTTPPATSPVPQNLGVAAKPKRASLTQQQRYYAAHDATIMEIPAASVRPYTANEAEGQRPKSRYSWGATRKLKRRSLM